MVDPDKVDADGFELPNRALHVVAPNKKIKLSIVYPATTGRNMDEVLRVVDILQDVERRKDSAAPAYAKAASRL
ncbi:hypothetical protein Taro_037208 [Colocasia esculenta]|uniref:Uncharacterized protein n=1 Tax=Colocasia esculenta TaxID=4460 RepID=A0A843W922_COLES|nr:hypothetical protein [Colocasia esculenta]